MHYSNLMKLQSLPIQNQIFTITIDSSGEERSSAATAVWGYFNDCHLRDGMLWQPFIISIACISYLRLNLSIKTQQKLTNDVFYLQNLCSWLTLLSVSHCSEWRRCHGQCGARCASSLINLSSSFSSHTRTHARAHTHFCCLCMSHRIHHFV